MLAPRWQGVCSGDLCDLTTFSRFVWITFFNAYKLYHFKFIYEMAFDLTRGAFKVAETTPIESNWVWWPISMIRLQTWFFFEFRSQLTKRGSFKTAEKFSLNLITLLMTVQLGALPYSVFNLLFYGFSNLQKNTKKIVQV